MKWPRGQIFMAHDNHLQVSLLAFYSMNSEGLLCSNRPCVFFLRFRWETISFLSCFPFFFFFFFLRRKERKKEILLKRPISRPCHVHTDFFVHSIMISSPSSEVVFRLVCSFSYFNEKNSVELILILTIFYLLFIKYIYIYI